MWHWLTQTGAGLTARIAAGVAIFSVLAIIDLRRNGLGATRWREYLVLVVCVVAAIVYGVANDLLTSSISWEYFCYGKGLWPDVVGSELPPAPLRLHLAASIVGMKATWSAGLIIGVAMLLANNPRASRPQLPFGSILLMLPLIAATAIIAAILLGFAGYAGGLTWLSDDFAQMLRNDEMRPRRFMMVFGIHLGGYIGGATGLIAVIIKIFVRRRLHATAPNRIYDVKSA